MLKLPVSWSPTSPDADHRRSLLCAQTWRRGRMCRYRTESSTKRDRPCVAIPVRRAAAKHSLRMVNVATKPCRRGQRDQEAIRRFEITDPEQQQWLAARPVK
jgi:hypothetical protein